MEAGQTRSVRLYAILARKAPVAVVFRRGPSKQVLLVRWRTDTDEFYQGQWLKARVYERRCDLSPSGERLIFFAANYKKPYLSWTAVSRPPFFTAVALWPKGDAWGGGGLFASETEILLNHPSNEMTLVDGFKLPPWVKVKPFGEHSGRGEDYPIAYHRLIRDGWNLAQVGKAIERSRRNRVWYALDPPEIWSKLNPLRGRNCELRMITRGIHERDGPWYVVEHAVVNKDSKMEASLGRTDWADWCHSGDLLIARDGKLFRLGFSEEGELLPLEEAHLLIDLRDRRFEPREAPAQAKVWGGGVPLPGAVNPPDTKAGQP